MNGLRLDPFVPYFPKPRTSLKRYSRSPVPQVCAHPIHTWLADSFSKPSPMYSLFKINALTPSCLPSIHQLWIRGAEVYKRTSTTTPLQELGSSWVVSSYITYSTNKHLAYIIIIIFTTIFITMGKPPGGGQERGTRASAVNVIDRALTTV